MLRRLVLVHWQQAEAEQMAASVRELGWEVVIESQDGGRAVRRILLDPPAGVLISLARLPSHGRETASALRTASKGRAIPIVFIDGSGEKLESIRRLFPEAVFTSSSNLGDTLEEGLN